MVRGTIRPRGEARAAGIPGPTAGAGGAAMPTEPGAVKALFLAATEKETPAERAAFLDIACVGDVTLRDRVEALLQLHDRPDDLLDRPAAGALLTAGPAAEDGVRGLLGPPRRPDSLGRLGPLAG